MSNMASRPLATDIFHQFLISIGMVVEAGPAVVSVPLHQPLRAPHMEENETTGNAQPQMQPYRNVEGGLGVVAYALGEDHITVEMHNGQTLCFTHQSAGRAYVEYMKLLARAGQGLNHFIFHDAKDRHCPDGLK
jgi:hypothetical protein